MSLLPLNDNLYGWMLKELERKDKYDKATDLELMVADLCRRVEYLENENRKIRSFAKKKD